MSEEFSDQLRRSVLWPHDRWGAMVEGMIGSYPMQRVAMDGTVSEVSRCYYYGNGQHPTEVTAADLVNMAYMEPTDFVLHHFREWLADADPAAAASGIPLLDLFYWEQRVGCWAAAALVELDLVQETFTPFNHRELLTTLLGVDRTLRLSPRYRLHRSLIADMWPAALSAPINPVPLSQHLRDLALTGLQALRLDGSLRRLRRWRGTHRHAA